MIELESITLSQYFDLSNEGKAKEYDFAMKFTFPFTDPVDEYKVGDLREQPFGLIKDMQYDIEQGISFTQLLEYIQTITKIKDLKDEPLDKLCRFIAYLKDGIEQILEVEQQTLAYEASDIEVSSGIDRFQGLGVYLQIRSLTGGDVTKYDAVRALPYHLCYTELYTSKQLKEFEQEQRKKSNTK
jgi:hypothetical protein